MKIESSPFGKTTDGREVLIYTLHNAHGMVGPVDPTSKKEGVHCYVLWKIHSNAFQRFNDPASSYRCDGKFLLY